MKLTAPGEWKISTIPSRVSFDDHDTKVYCARVSDDKDSTIADVYGVNRDACSSRAALIAAAPATAAERDSLREQLAEMTTRYDAQQERALDYKAERDALKKENEELVSIAEAAKRLVAYYNEFNTIDGRDIDILDAALIARAEEKT